MKATKLLGILCLLLCLLSLSIGAGSFSWTRLLVGDAETWLLFLESRLPRTISILLAGSSMSMSGLLMQTITQNPFAAPSTVGTVDAAKLGMLISLFFFPSATLAQKMLFAFLSSIFFTIFFIRFVRQFSFKEKWLLPLVGIIYSGVIGAAGEIISYRFNLVQSMTSWTQGSFSMIQRHQYEWLFLSLAILLAVWRLSATFTIMNLGEEASQNLGIRYAKMEGLALFLTALTTSVTMITVGSLPFLGVIVPNLVRKFCGDHIKRIKTIIALTGACLVLICDIAARLVIRPYEVSVSLILGICGSLAFMYLLWRGAAHE
ncbi:Iron compound ABC uptake transporter permease protein PiuB [Streptococcus sp. DD11]|uniref:ABC transporter permease n=1 Tax=Streptococcus sp. DD11 TaxID=1777879 RepID=UPI000797D3D9|nr:iron chelate uptake ABC transporter family permease subunit [Streptococcus sp. DD11]KXT81986.1 Iron compound ABC uptake transporter permease protein PiuB [Streptococcus sp. DD11]